MCTKKWFLSLLALLSPVMVSAQTHYDYTRLQRERLDRGLVAVRTSPDSVFLSWRYLGSDPLTQSFTLLRNGRKIADIPARHSTTFMDCLPEQEAARYEVVPAEGNVKGHWNLAPHSPLGYVDIPILQPEGVPAYSANDASVADLDGDGQYEIVLKWEPGNAKDNSHSGFTLPVILDAYKLDGTRLWRINLGRNIRAGAHYTQFMVYDLDGDGKAEVVIKTADGTTDGTGRVIGDAQADWRHGDPKAESRYSREKVGFIDRGPEYLTVFEGKSGKALHTVPYVPERGDIRDWGDNYANRSERYLACVAYLDGVHASVVMCRGYYTRMALAAYDFIDGKLQLRWLFDSNVEGAAYHGQGNHNLRVGDVDGDGKDEILYGSCAIDDDGHGLYSTGMGHGDAMHLTAFSPESDRLAVWNCHENKKDGAELHDAATGEILCQFFSPTDVGRCMAADITPENPGVEMWSLCSGITNTKGEEVAPLFRGLSTNMAVWWDGDLLRELLDREAVTKYDWKTNSVSTLMRFQGCKFNNWTKSNPCLQGDLLGDWREEVLVRTEDNAHLRLYVSTLPTEYRFHTFLEEPVYRISIATQNVGYNQPTQPGFFFGHDLKGSGRLFRGWQF